MDMRRANNYSQCVNVLLQLHKEFPTYNMGRHLSTALSEYGDVWNLPDKELLFALEKYKAQLDMDFPHSERDIDEIIKDGLDLDNILKEEDNGDY